MKKLTTRVLILAFFCALGSPVGGFFVWVMNILFFWATNSQILPAHDSSPWQPVVLAEVIELSYFLGFLPSLAVGSYVANSAVNKKPFYVGGGYSIGVVTAFFNSLITMFFIIHAALAAAFSFFVLHRVVRFFLSLTEFALIDPPPEESLGTV